VTGFVVELLGRPRRSVRELQVEARDRDVDGGGAVRFVGQGEVDVSPRSAQLHALVGEGHRLTVRDAQRGPGVPKRVPIEVRRGVEPHATGDALGGGVAKPELAVVGDRELAFDRAELLAEQRHVDNALTHRRGAFDVSTRVVRRQPRQQTLRPRGRRTAPAGAPARPRSHSKSRRGTLASSSNAVCSSSSSSNRAPSASPTFAITARAGT
jgi:hypothetical protein